MAKTKSKVKRRVSAGPQWYPTVNASELISVSGAQIAGDENRARATDRRIPSIFATRTTSLLQGTRIRVRGITHNPSSSMSISIAPLQSLSLFLLPGFLKVSSSVFLYPNYCPQRPNMHAQIRPNGQKVRPAQGVPTHRRSAAHEGPGHRTAGTRRKRETRVAQGGIPADPAVMCRPRGKSAWESTRIVSVGHPELRLLHTLFRRVLDEFGTRFRRVWDAFDTRLQRVVDAATTRHEHSRRHCLRLPCMLRAPGERRKFLSLSLSVFSLPRPRPSLCAVPPSQRLCQQPALAPASVAATAAREEEEEEGEEREEEKRKARIFQVGFIGLLETLLTIPIAWFRFSYSMAAHSVLIHYFCNL
ncbi:hypothetical protein AXF42_Ash017819 [Apostasia shenzhenica]|uniref:Uncharacterized protein n=1 Tax=Apostasia shenzhenica TaxID=1088818 RepID=A0A2I0A3V1_9ASPA|nr:hypothetical protein AXF42_Ash017819 [Apostasia shenzhenica]